MFSPCRDGQKAGQVDQDLALSEFARLSLVQTEAVGFAISSIAKAPPLWLAGPDMRIIPGLNRMSQKVPGLIGKIANWHAS